MPMSFEQKERAPQAVASLGCAEFASSSNVPKKDKARVGTLTATPGKFTTSVCVTLVSQNLKTAS